MKNKTVLDQVTSCLQEQLKCYDVLLEKMEVQKQAIGLPDESRLMSIIKENDALIGATQELEAKIGVILKGIATGERDAIVRATSKLRGHIETRLKQLIALEKACEEALNHEKSRIFEQIKEIQQNKGVLKKYWDTGEEISWFSKKA